MLQCPDVIYDVCSHLKVHNVFVAGKLPGHHCVGLVLYINNMTLEYVNDSVPGLFHIFYIAPVPFQEIKGTIALVCDIHLDTVCPVIS